MFELILVGELLARSLSVLVGHACRADDMMPHEFEQAVLHRPLANCILTAQRLPDCYWSHNSQPNLFARAEVAISTSRGSVRECRGVDDSPNDGMAHQMLSAEHACRFSAHARRAKSEPCRSTPPGKRAQACGLIHSRQVQAPRPNSQCQPSKQGFAADRLADLRKSR